MKERIVTGVVLIGVILVVAFINNPYLTGFFLAIVGIGAIFETQRLINSNDNVIPYILFGGLFFSIFINPILVGVISILLAAAYVSYYQKEIKPLMLGVYPFFPLLFIYELYFKEGMEILIWLLLIVALTDTFAYVVGKNFGKKIFQRGFSLTSPNKSIEGVIGGVLIGSIAGSIYGLYFFEFWISLVISFGVSVSGVFGDLFESLLKRKAGVKDSGNILPGHGGVLDRIDAYLFASPLMWAIFYGLDKI